MVTSRQKTHSKADKSKLALVVVIAMIAIINIVNAFSIIFE
jgi:hypothetical protein